MVTFPFINLNVIILNTSIEILKSDSTLAALFVFGSLVMKGRRDS